MAFLASARDDRRSAFYVTGPHGIEQRGERRPIQVTFVDATDCASLPSALNERRSSGVAGWMDLRFASVAVNPVQRPCGIGIGHTTPVQQHKVEVCALGSDELVDDVADQIHQDARPHRSLPRRVSGCRHLPVVSYARLDNWADVEKGEALGVVPDPLGEAETEVLAPVSGIIVGCTNLPVVNEGDALFNIAESTSERLGDTVDEITSQLKGDALFDEDEIL